MGTSAARGSDKTIGAPVGSIDMKLEAVVIPVSDVDRAKRFYAGLGWRLDADFSAGDGRVVQFTPPGSDCSVHFGTNMTSARPGSAQYLFLIVPDIQAARADLLAHGVAVSDVFHFAGLNHLDASARLSGPDPEGRSYDSYASFSDPDGNAWLLQEVTRRLPGRMDPAATTFSSSSDLAAALRRAEAAHGEHERRTGQRDANWPAWYAAYIAAEQNGQALPS
jgi:catechol 2,3-dioxygenase-like lactoylglutathione lyase family enzyme